MIKGILHAAHRLDDRLKETIGRPYNAILGVGLVVEIIERVRDLHEAPASGMTVFRLALAILFYLLLLIHQLGELSDHAARRRAGQ